MFEDRPISQDQFRPEPPEIPKEGGGSPPDIYTMPQKFMNKEGKGGGKVNKLLIIILLIVVFAGVAFGAVILFNRLANTNENANGVVANLNLNENENLNENLNLNLNENVNENLNDNLNINENLNLNENANLNDNLNGNLNQNSNLNANISIIPPTSSLDSDDDGLTDVEETLYGAGNTTPDTDGDGFIDGKKVQSSGDIIGELYLGYDPTAKSARLEGSSLVKRYTNVTYNWSILYPAKWTATQTSTATGDKSIMFSPDVSTVEYLQVSVQDNPTNLSAKNWYLSQNPGVSESEVESLVVNGLDGIKSPDGTTVYLSKQDKIYWITYSTGNLTLVNYLTTFEMMYQSFKLVSSSVTETNVNSNTNTNINTNSNSNLSF